MLAGWLIGKPSGAPATPSLAYFEATIDASGPGTAEDHVCIGIASGSFNLTDAWDLDVNGTGPTVAEGLFMSVKNGATLGWGYPTRPSIGGMSAATGTVIGVAVNKLINRVWFRNATSGPTGWLPGGDPAAGTGGSDFSSPSGATPVTEPIYVTAGGYWNPFLSPPPCVLTVNFGAAAFEAAAPTGFSPWDASGATTLNPSDADSRLTLSNGNLTATRQATAGGLAMSRSTTSI